MVHGISGVRWFNLPDDANLFGFSKKAEDGLSSAGGSSKTFPQVPIEFRVSRGKQESRLIIRLGLGVLKG